MKIAMSMAPEGIIKSVDGAKTWTTRMNLKGRPGDTFDLVDPRTQQLHEFKLEGVQAISAMVLVNGYYQQEGYKSPAECRAALWGFYPELKPHTILYAHKYGAI
jgi:hypothetical protein